MENSKVKVWIEGDIIFEKVVGVLDGDDIRLSTRLLTKTAEDMAAKGYPSLVAIDVSQAKGLTKEGRAVAAKDFDNTNIENGGGVVMYGLNSLMTTTIRLLAFISPRMKIAKFVTTKEQAVEYLRGLAKKAD